MLVSRLVALGFVVITALLVTIFTSISDPTAGATRLPAQLDLRPVEIAAEPFDALAPLYLAGGEQDPQVFAEALAQTHAVVGDALIPLIASDMAIDLPPETIARLVTETVEATLGEAEAEDLFATLMRGVPTEAASEVEAARLAANPTPAPTTVLSLTAAERRVIEFGDKVAGKAVNALLRLQSEDGPLALALKEAGKIEQVSGISARATRTSRVAVRTIEMEGYTPVRPTPASTEAERRTDVRTRTGSTVMELLVERGDDVTQGQVLLRLDPDDRPARRAQALASIAQGEAGILQSNANLSAAEAQMIQAQTTLQDAKDNLADTQTLVEGGARGANALRDAEVRVEQAEQSLLVAESGLAQAEAALAQAEASVLSAQASLEQIDLDIERLTITAPFSGRVEERFVELGSSLHPGEPVVRLAQLDMVKVTAQVSDGLRQILQLGQDIDVSIGGSEERHTGEITFLGATSGDQTRTFEVQITLPNPKDGSGQFAFADNQFATAYFVEPEQMIYRIPLSTLTSASINDRGEGSTGLRVVDEEDRVAFLPLEQTDYAEGGDLLIDAARLDSIPTLRLIIARGGFVEIGDKVFAREELTPETVE